MPIENNAYGNSQNARHSTTGPLLRGGSRCRNRKNPGSSVANVKNPRVRIAQGKPTRLISSFVINEKIKPPVPQSVMIAVIATARRRSK